MSSNASLLERAFLLKGQKIVYRGCPVCSKQCLDSVQQNLNIQNLHSCSLYERVCGFRQILFVLKSSRQFCARMFCGLMHFKIKNIPAFLLYLLLLFFSAYDVVINETLKQIDQLKTSTSDSAAKTTPQQSLPDMTSSYANFLKPDTLDILQIHHTDISETNVPEKQSSHELTTSKL